MKYCKSCDSMLEDCDFNKNKSKPDGMQYKCRKCESACGKCNREMIAERASRYRATHRKAISMAIARRRKANPEKTAEQRAKYYTENKERVVARAAAWNKAHPESLAEWKRLNSEKISGYIAERRSKITLSKQSRRKTVLYRKKIKDSVCHYCGNRTTKMQYDHVYPFKMGGTDHWWNLVRACSTCNQRKSRKLYSEFVKEEAA